MREKELALEDEESGMKNIRKRLTETVTKTKMKILTKTKNKLNARIFLTKGFFLENESSNLRR